LEDKKNHFLNVKHLLVSHYYRKDGNNILSLDLWHIPLIFNYIHLILSDYKSRRKN